MDFYFKEVSLRETWEEGLKPLVIAHNAETNRKLKKDGVETYELNIDYEYFASLDANGYLKTFVITYKNMIVGYAIMQLFKNLQNGNLMAEESGLYLSPECRFNGIGTAFVKYVAENLKERDVKGIIAYSLTDKNTSKFYEKLGFVEISRQFQLDLK